MAPGPHFVDGNSNKMNENRNWIIPVSRVEFTKTPR